MNILLNRTEKLAILSKIVKNRLSSKDISDMRKGWEPLQVTLILNDSEELFELESNEPTYHIEIYTDGTTKRYYRHSDGLIEYR